MFGFAWSEIILIGAVALVVIGPKDLPRVMRTAGQWSRKLRVLAGDFQRHVDDMVRQAELDEVKREAEKAMNVGDVAADFEKSVGATDFDQAVKHDAQAEAAAEVPPVPLAENPIPSTPRPDEPQSPADTYGSIVPGADDAPAPAASVDPGLPEAAPGAIVSGAEPVPTSAEPVTTHEPKP